MPIYNYHCPKCGAEYELLQPMNAEKTIKCEQCGCVIPRSIPTGMRAVYRGTGWTKQP